MPVNSNPFSTRFTRPGAIPFLFDEHLNAETILRRFEASNWLAQIVGPHGSGKTTLVRELESHLITRFATIKYVAIRKSKKRLVVEPQFLVQATDDSTKPDLLVVDGVESISRLNRWLLKTWCRQHKTGLLATMHQPSQWLPTIATLRPESRAFLSIGDWLQRSTERKLDHESCSRALEVSNGNYREAFMTLYDQYESEARRMRCEPVKV